MKLSLAQMINAFILIVVLIWGGINTSMAQKNVVAINIQNYSEIKSAELLIKSIKDFGGELAKSDILVTSTLEKGTIQSSLAKYNVKIFPLTIDSTAAKYPFAYKAYSCAQIENAIKGEDCNLIWFDNGCLVLNEPKDLFLDPIKKVAFRPVFLQNSVAEKETDPIGSYWEGIYKLAGLDSSKVIPVETFIDSEMIRFYINCQVITVDPSLGIFNKWLEIQTKLINDSNYQLNACNTGLRKIFLHQAALSAAILSKVNTNEIQWLSNSCGFPVHLWDQIPDNKKIDINSASVLIYEEIFTSKPDWMKYLKLNEPIVNWITNNYKESLKICEGIYRLENSCNSYLVVTENGRVIVDPGGASKPENWLSKIEVNKPLKGIILTHGHEDHTTGTNYWDNNNNTPVYAHNNIVDFIAYQDMLAPFTASRVAKQRGLPQPDSSTVYPKTNLGNLKLFCHKNTFSIDNLSFEMEHVGGETPDNSTIWVPEYKAFFIADNYYTSFPNLYTLRGTQTRPALQYINALNLALSKKPEYLLMGHGEPLIGWEKIEPALTTYRNAIQYVHDETVKGINLGKSVYTLMDEVKLPEEYRKNISESYGKVSWSVRGIYEGYIGWFDGNITNMYNAHPSIVYNDLLNLAGKENLIEKIKDYMANEKFAEALVLTDILLSANSNDKEAIDLRMQTLVQLSRKSSNWIEMNWLRSEYKSLNEIKKEIDKK